MITERSTSSFWARLDAVMVINLNHRPERWQEAKSQLLDFVPETKLHRVSAVLGKTLSGYGNRPWFRGRKRDETWAARGGCALSHRKALCMAQKNNWDTVLILEDDVSFDTTFDAISEGLSQRLFEGQQEWQLCYLGFTDPLSPFRKEATFDKNVGLFRVFGCNTAHAYLVSVEIRDWLLERLPTEENVWAWLSRNRAVDRWYMQTVGQRFSVLCVSPSKVNQTPGFSDIAGRATDYSNTNQHQLAVPDEVTAKAFFRTRYRLRKVSLFISRMSDYLRGWLKSITGF